MMQHQHTQPKAIRVNLRNTHFTIPLVNAEHLSKLSSNASESVHILASGPSIRNTDFSSICKASCMFVNGSIELTSKLAFEQPAAYVVSDSRFIRHNLDLLLSHYEQNACDFYLTHQVLNALILSAPAFIEKHHDKMRVIHSATKPHVPGVLPEKSSLFSKFIRREPRIDLIELEDDFVISDDVGVSLNVENGFVEAGTVTYIAAQLAYSMGYGTIYVHGMDLINANEPRFYETANTAAPSKLDKAITNRIVPSFDLMSKAYKKNDVSVYNCSPVSKTLFHHMAFSAYSG